jgi:hypothetical protein
MDSIVHKEKKPANSLTKLQISLFMEERVQSRNLLGEENLDHQEQISNPGIQ